MTLMFYECYSLQSVPALVVSAVTDFGVMFTNCRSLASAPLSGPAQNISFVSCKLARDEIVAIFNGLANAAKTITITGNWGIAALTANDRKIATDKGWTVTEA